MLQTAIAKEKEEVLKEGIQLGEAKGKRAQQRLTAQRMREAGQPDLMIAFILEISEVEVQTLLDEHTDK